MKPEEQRIRDWINEYSEKLLNRAFYLLSDRDDAKDIVQDVFLAAYNSLDNFQGKSSPLTWLQNILTNKVSDFYRKKYKKPSSVSLDHFFDESGSWKTNDVLNSWNDDTENSPNEPQIENTLEDCLEELPPKWKIPVKLYYLQEKKSEEVCQETGITTTNLWKILQRSRLQLRECIETNWFEKNR